MLGVGAADLQLRLFEALVRPVMDFAKSITGAAVWGPMVAQAGGVKEAEDLCMQFLRLPFGVKSSAVGWCYCERSAGPRCGRLGYAMPRDFGIEW